MSDTEVDRMWCRALAEEIGDRPDLIEKINYNAQRSSPSGVMIGCLGCSEGVPYEEAEGWEYTTDTGWLCPNCQDRTGAEGDE